MSDELPPGSIDLESDGAESVALVDTAPPAAVVAAPVEPPAEPEAPKLVPLSALQAERDEKKQLRDRLAQVEAWAAQNKPYVDFVQANPHFLQQPKPTAPVAPDVHPADVEYAKLLDLYKADGTPDTDRAAKFRGLVAQEARTIATNEVAPIRQQTAQDQSAVNFQRALQIKDGSGKSPTEGNLRAIFSTMSPEETANPQMAGLAAMFALGLERMQPQAPVVAPPANPPVYTEASGGIASAKPLSAFEQRMATERGRTPQQWQELAKGYQKGVPTQLED